MISWFFIRLINLSCALKRNCSNPNFSTGFDCHSGAASKSSPPTGGRFPGVSGMTVSNSSPNIFTRSSTCLRFFAVYSRGLPSVNISPVTRLSTVISHPLARGLATSARCPPAVTPYIVISGLPLPLFTLGITASTSLSFVVNPRVSLVLLVTFLSGRLEPSSNGLPGRRPPFLLLSTSEPESPSRDGLFVSLALDSYPSRVSARRPCAKASPIS